MGLTAIVSSASSVSSVSSVGVGAGGVFVAIALLATLAYLDVIEVDDGGSERVNTMLYAVVTPLAVAFSGIVLFNTLQAL